MNKGITIIVGAGTVLDFDHKGIFPSVKNTTDEVLKLSIQKVDGGERLLLHNLNKQIIEELKKVGISQYNRWIDSSLKQKRHPCGDAFSAIVSVECLSAW